MKRVVRILAIAGVVAGTALSAVPASASAGTYTKILTPKGPGKPFYQYFNAATSTGTFSVSGQTSLDITTNVNIYCLYDSDRKAQGPLNSALMAWGLVDEPVALVRNETGVLIGMVHVMVPYAVLTLYANMRGIDAGLVSAARSLGASRFQAFRMVFLPLTRPGLIGAGTLVFILSLGFYVSPALLGCVM